MPFASRTFMSAVLVANGNHGFAPSSRPDGNLSTHEPQNHVLWEKNAISGLKQFQDFYDKNSSTHQTHVRFFGKCQKKGQHQAHQQKKHISPAKNGQIFVKSARKTCSWTQHRTQITKKNSSRLPARYARLHIQPRIRILNAPPYNETFRKNIKDPHNDTKSHDFKMTWDWRKHNQTQNKNLPSSNTNTARRAHSTTMLNIGELQLVLAQVWCSSDTHKQTVSYA